MDDCDFIEIADFRYKTGNSKFKYTLNLGFGLGFGFVKTTPSTIVPDNLYRG